MLDIYYGYIFLLEVIYFGRFCEFFFNCKIKSLAWTSKYPYRWLFLNMFFMSSQIFLSTSSNETKTDSNLVDFNSKYRCSYRYEVRTGTKQVGPLALIVLAVARVPLAHTTHLHTHSSSLVQCRRKYQQRDVFLTPYYILAYQKT